MIFFPPFHPLAGPFLVAAPSNLNAISWYVDTEEAFFFRVLDANTFTVKARYGPLPAILERSHFIIFEEDLTGCRSGCR